MGQRQLVSFARALVADPRILILDEATASIDTYTELLIQEALKELLKDRTAIVIAHRLSTVRNADRIAVVDEGRIVEQVNLPATQKWTPPQYQDLEAGDVALMASEDGGALVRLIAGDLGEQRGPGSTKTPITYAHASISPGARLHLPWRQDFNALVYVLGRQGFGGS